MIVDAHHHLWSPVAPYRWLDEPRFAPIRRDFGVGELREVLRANGVDRTVLVESGRCDRAETEEFLELAAGVDEIAGVVGWVDLAAEDLAQTLAAHAASGPLVGVRTQVQGEADPDYLRRPEVQSALRLVGEAGLVFDLVVRVDQLPGAAAAARALPEVGFVLDHLGKPAIAAGGFTPWREAVAELAELPNVSAKLSGLVTEADWTGWTVDDLRPYLEAALRLWGPERLMFGSDWPVCLLAADYRQVMGTLLHVLRPRERDAVFSGTALRVYRLDEYS